MASSGWTCIVERYNDTSSNSLPLYTTTWTLERGPLADVEYSEEFLPSGSVMIRRFKTGLF